MKEKIFKISAQRNVYQGRNFFKINCLHTVETSQFLNFTIFPVEVQSVSQSYAAYHDKRMEKKHPWDFALCQNISKI